MAQEHFDLSIKYKSVNNKPGTMPPRNSYDNPTNVKTRFAQRLFPISVGYVLAKSTSKLAGTTVSAHAGGPLLLAALFGLPITVWPWSFFAKGLRELLDYQPYYIRMLSMAAFHLSMAFLTFFVGLIIISSFMSLAFSPFTLPCLITAAVTGGIFCLAAIAVAVRMQYFVSEPQSMPEGAQPLHPKSTAASKLLDAFVPTNSGRPFDYSQIKNKEEIINGCWVVQPFGTKINVQKEKTAQSGAKVFKYSLFGGKTEVLPAEALTLSVTPQVVDNIAYY